jgi:hypothetical protein
MLKMSIFSITISPVVDGIGCSVQEKNRKVNNIRQVVFIALIANYSSCYTIIFSSNIK